MRLSVLDHGHHLRARLFLGMVGRLSGRDMPDIVKLLLYRPEFFGRPMLAVTVPAMRGPSYWTAGEREYLAARTALVFGLGFCIDAHSELTRIASEGELDVAGPVRPELAAVWDFVETVIRDRPDRALVADVPEHAVREALHVGLVWNTINRLGLAFGFELRPGQLESGTRALHRMGYRMPGLLLRGRMQRDGDLVEGLRRAVFDAPARTTKAMRAAAGGEGLGDDLAEPLASYAATVRTKPHQVSAEDLDRLAAAGHDEDEVFEVTVAAAVGAALRGFAEAADATR